MIWLGVDGGGTKTAFALVDDTGRVLAATTSVSSYYFSEGLDAVRAVLRGGIVAVCNDAGIAPGDIDQAFFGLPGYGEVSADVAILDALPAPVLGHDRYTCDNDMVCGWAGSLGAVDGINVVAGTGSMTYGERAGRGVRVGGWGEVFGDEGSAHWIGVEGLRAASRMSDGRLERGPLVDVVVDHLGLAAEIDLVDVVLNRWKGNRLEVAALARQVSAAADRGDVVATGILTAAAGELALLVTTTRGRLDWPDTEPVPVSWSGGVFGSDVVLEHFRAVLAGDSGEHQLREPLLGPSLGAALHAARTAGRPLDADARDRLAAGGVPTRARSNRPARPIREQM